jgi:cell division protein FtsA
LFAEAKTKVDFAREVRPILSNYCFHCHGPDDKNRKGGEGKGLRLDQEEGARADLGGHFAVVPLHPEKSEILERILSTDSDEVMPPPKTGKKPTAKEIEIVEFKAKEAGIPKDDVIIHSVIQRYYVDGQEGVIDPHGMMGTKLDADFHIIHGVTNRIQNAIRCVREFDIDVEDIVVNSVASAQVVLDEQQKQAGAVLIDIGGGVTDYIVYKDGAVCHSGVIAIGGDHITNDLCIGLRIPIARAEKLKIEEGSAITDNISASDKITLKNDTGFSGRDIDRLMLNMIIRARLEELFTILHKRIQEVVPEHLLGAGILLTGGCSLLRGIREAAESVFPGTPVYLAHAQAVSGPMSAFENPQLSTCIGAAKYAQAVHAEMPDASILERLKGFFSGRF